MPDAISLSPDELIETIIEEIIVLHLASAKLNQIWDIVCDSLQRTGISEGYKLIIWSWLIRKPEIEVYVNDLLTNVDPGMSLTDLIVNVAHNKPENITVKIEEGKQYLYLTARPKEGNPIGQFPFNLLKHIISRKEKGISGAELVRVLDQDPRSLTGRLALLEKEGLIKKKAANIPGITTSLVIHTNYYVKGKESVPTIDRLQLKKQIIDVIKNSKNRIRTQRDVAEGLGYASSKLVLSKFRRITRSLCVKGYLKPVLVAPRLDPSIRPTTRALMFIKDLETETNDSDLDDDDDDDDDIGDLDAADDDADQTISSSSVSKAVLEDDNIKIFQDDDESALPVPILSSHFPIPSQIYEVVKKSGTSGTTAMQINKLMSDKSTEWFRRYFQDLKFGPQKGLEHLLNHNIVKVLDSEGKIKFYRYFMQEEYSRLAHEKMPEIAGEFQTLHKFDESQSLLALSLEHSKSLASLGLDTVECPDGVVRLNWTGITDPQIRSLHLQQLKDADILTSVSFISETTGEELAVITQKLTAQQQKKLVNPTSSGRGRGRVKKSEQELAVKRSASQEAATKNLMKRLKTAPGISQVKQESSSGIPSGIMQTLPTNGSSSFQVEEPTLSPIPAPSAPAPIEKAQDRFNINFAGLGGSIRSNLRRKEIIQMLKENHGVLVVDAALSRIIGKRMKLTTVIDKSTVKKDADFLADQGLITIRELNGKTVLVDDSLRPRESQIEEAVELSKNPMRNTATVEPEVVNVAIEFKHVVTPRAFLPRKTSALGKRLTGAKPSAVSIKSRTESSSRKVKLKSKLEKEPKEELDPMLSYLSTLSGLKRKAVAKKTTARKKKSELGQLVRDRRRETYDSEYLITVLKVHTIVNSLLTNKTSIDWKAIAAVLGDESQHARIRKRWPHIRRQLRFATLPKIRDSWERFLTVAVKNKWITFDMLLNLEYKKMYEVWNENEVDDFSDDNLNLFANYLDNFVEHEVNTHYEEKIIFSALPSSLEKNRYLKSCSFTRPAKRVELRKDKSDETKAVLKSIFSTEVKNFDSKRARDILASLGDYFGVLKEMEIKKEISYLGENSESKFALPERTWLQFQHKFNGEFFEGCTKFLKALSEVVDAGKGMALSAMTPDYSLVPIFHLIVEGKIKIILVDRVIHKDFAGYFTRNFNKQMLESDFILTMKSPKSGSIEEMLPSVPVPLGGACSRVWIDMKGNLKSDLWKNIIKTLLYHIYFKPGINAAELSQRTSLLLLPFELEEVLKWLEDKNAVKYDDNDNGYMVQPYFFTVTG